MGSRFNPSTVPPPPPGYIWAGNMLVPDPRVATTTLVQTTMPDVPAENLPAPAPRQEVSTGKKVMFAALLFGSFGVFIGAIALSRLIPHRPREPWWYSAAERYMGVPKW